MGWGLETVVQATWDYLEDDTGAAKGHACGVDHYVELAGGILAKTE